MTEWEPATEAEAAMRDALRANDQELYFRILARTELLLPVSAEALAGQAPMGWGTWTTGGRTHVLAFTSEPALRACLGESGGANRRSPYPDLAAGWPNHEWWLAVNPGLPIEGYLPAWFVSQLSRGDVRLPGRTLGARARLERVEQIARNRAETPGPPDPAPRTPPTAPPYGSGHPPAPVPPRRSTVERLSADPTEAIRFPPAGPPRRAPEPSTRPGPEPPTQPMPESPARPGVESPAGGEPASSWLTNPRRTARPEPGPPANGQPTGRNSFFEPAPPGRSAGPAPISPLRAQDRGAPPAPPPSRPDRGVAPSRLGDPGRAFPRRRPYPSGDEPTRAFQFTDQAPGEPPPPPAAPPPAAAPPAAAAASPVAGGRSPGSTTPADQTQALPRRQPAPDPAVAEPTQALPRRTPPPPGAAEPTQPLFRASPGAGEPAGQEPTQPLFGRTPPAADGSVGAEPTQPVPHPAGPTAPFGGGPNGTAPAPEPAGSPRPRSPIVIEGTVVESRNLAGPASAYPTGGDVDQAHHVSPEPAYPAGGDADPAYHAAPGQAYPTGGPADPVAEQAHPADLAPGQAYRSDPGVAAYQAQNVGTAAPNAGPVFPTATGPTDPAPNLPTDPAPTGPTDAAAGPAGTAPVEPAGKAPVGLVDAAPTGSAEAAAAGLADVVPAGLVDAAAVGPPEPTGPPDPTGPAAPVGSADPVGPGDAAAPAGAGIGSPTGPELDFRPANEVEENLLAAVGAGSTDTFLSTLLLARVLLPVARDSAPGARPGESGFVWRTEQIDGETYVVVYTSPERLKDHAIVTVETVRVKFVQLIRRWPDERWSFAVNPGSPVGAKLPGEQIVALANWAAEVGLGDDAEPEPTPETPAVAAPVSPARYATTPEDPKRPPMMQKAVAPSQLAYYLERGYDRVSGFVHRAGEVAHLNTPARLYGALGLGYPDSPFSPDADEIYVLRWPAYRPSLYRIPYGGQNEGAMRAMEGWVIERPPFRGNGFAPGESSDVVAEFKVDSARLPHGTQLWRIGADGSERVVAVLDTDALLWRQVGEA
ncbi:SseB family protein [Micromonospora sp. WMMD882]|uniref:SseB family protein n=1 Tax=Micromonospora sp. WMMD882 TaxID=3015151 RepID=UPI00248CF729|nr:SseB family protein [Micromonospora sp. WMMD882]WBB77939.1 SseB family protein [Micromonospora sp. WMMD882]